MREIVADIIARRIESGGLNPKTKNVMKLNDLKNSSDRTQVDDKVKKIKDKKVKN